MFNLKIFNALNIYASAKVNLHCDKALSAAPAMQLIKRKLRTVFEHLHPNSSSEKAKQDRTNSMTMKRQRISLMEEPWIRTKFLSRKTVKVYGPRLYKVLMD
ncbi:hypothetical protein T4B_2803 [Trichinella pseudospiralis]|uniref:Uncharacterized protein n=1 Tax=Trichinella pseudospiralis TaxID=6337 RepID=A0A0V1E483_TRIPS|nr:hypothetical protein T4A_11547 [Trichinella pseudospiralis]KRZ25850.1 hypothetical protein T4B_2803 [Trichinella pseudospiralis]